jgi:hypothetical protein
MIFFKKIKNGLGPAAVALGGRVLPPEVLSCRHTPQQQGLNAVGHGGRYAASMRRRPVPAAVRYDGRCIILEFFGSSIYFSKIKEKIYKKI